MARGNLLIVTSCILQVQAAEDRSLLQVGECLTTIVCSTNGMDIAYKGEVC